jgi:uncharacterized protein YbaP (TraB family)
MADLQSLSIEMIVSGIVGLITFGLIAKGVISGYREAQKHLKSEASKNPIIHAMASSWDRDERTRFMELMERLVIAEEHQAKAQTVLADQRQQDMSDKLDDLVERMKNLPSPRPK